MGGDGGLKFEKGGVWARDPQGSQDLLQVSRSLGVKGLERASTSFISEKGQKVMGGKVIGKFEGNGATQFAIPKLPLGKGKNLLETFLLRNNPSL